MTPEEAALTLMGEKKFRPEDFKLCYVEDAFVFFTTQDLQNQWGDDWDDAPYEHNASAPYSPSWADKEAGKHWEILRIAYLAWEVSNLPNEGLLNSPWNVKDINAKKVPWLRSYARDGEKPAVEIWAGTTLPEFIKVIRENKGTVYMSVEFCEGLIEENRVLRASFENQE